MWLQNRKRAKLAYLSWVLRGLKPTTVPYSWHIMWYTGFKKSKGQQLKLCKSMNPFTVPELSFYSSKLNSIHLSFMTALIDSLFNIITCFYWKDVNINYVSIFFSDPSSLCILQYTWSWVYFQQNFYLRPFHQALDWFGRRLFNSHLNKSTDVIISCFAFSIYEVACTAASHLIAIGLFTRVNQLCTWLCNCYN